MAGSKKTKTNMTAAAEAAREAKKLIAPIKNEIVTLLTTLVRTNSVAVPPVGNEAAAQKELTKVLKRYKLDVEMYDTAKILKTKDRYVRRDRNYEGRPNVVARVAGGGSGKSVLFSGHIDTVPPGPGVWKKSPWSGHISAGKLYGRGAWDMKGGLVAQFGALMALAKAGKRLAGDVIAESVVDEEWGGGGGTLAGRLRGDNADACVIPEGTNMSVVRATRGGHFFDIIARAGDPSAYFSKEEVVSPAVPMGRMLAWVDEWTQKRKKIERGETYKDFPDPVPVQVCALEANRFDPDVPLAVPLVAKLRVYFQFLPQENVEAVLRQIRKSFDAFCRKDPFFKVYKPEWKDFYFPPLLGHELAADHPWTVCMAEAASATVGKEVSVSAAEYPCDAFIVQKFYKTPTLLFGPEGAGAHNADEYVKVASVVKTAESLLAAALLWCG